MRRLFLAPALALIALLAACASSGERGDRAAATGDWKTAEAHYAQALRANPNDADARAKWQQARAEALADAAARNRACRVAQDWDCALAESDYLARLEPGRADHARLRADDARNVAYGRLRSATEASRRGDHRAAFDALNQARSVSNDPGVAAEASRVAPALADAAVQTAQAWRAQQRYPEAVELLTLAAGVDGRVGPLLDQVRGEQADWMAAQYDQALRDGDARLRAGRFAEAAQAYDAALALRNGGPAAARSRYAHSVLRGDDALRRRDWQSAAAAYDDALRTGVEGRDGYAGDQLARLQPRPYEIRLRSVQVRLPHDGRPSLIATLVLPDGRRYVTAPARPSPSVRFESLVVATAFAYDDRPVTIRIDQAIAKGTVEIGTVGVRLSDLLNGREVVLRDRAVTELRLVAAPSSRADGWAQGFAPVRPPPPPPAPKPPGKQPR